MDRISIIRFDPLKILWYQYNAISIMCLVTHTTSAIFEIAEDNWRYRETWRHFDLISSSVSRETIKSGGREQGGIKFRWECNNELYEPRKSLVTENSSPWKSLLQWPHRHRLFRFSKRGGKGNPLPGVGEWFKYLISSFPLYRAFLNPISTLL